MRNKTYNSRLCHDTIIHRTPSLVDEFYKERIGGTKEKPLVRYVDPLYMLFNQQRLDRLGADNIKQWLDSMNNAGNSEIGELKKKCSDEQLVQLIKSRHLQSPSEVLAWCRYINDNVTEFNESMQKIAEQKKLESETPPKTE